MAGRTVKFLDRREEYDPANVSISSPIEPEDTKGDGGYVRLVHATVEQAKLDAQHRCGYVACGSPAHVARGRKDCPLRVRAERFLRDMRRGRHWLSGWVTLAAMRSGLSIAHEPDHEMLPPVFIRSVDPEEPEPIEREPIEREPREHPSQRDVRQVRALGLLTTDEVAQRLGVHRNSVLNFTAEGELTKNFVGRARGFDPAAVDAFMQSPRYRAMLDHRDGIVEQQPETEAEDDAVLV